MELSLYGISDSESMHFEPIRRIIPLFNDVDQEVLNEQMLTHFQKYDQIQCVAILLSQISQRCGVLHTSVTNTDGQCKASDLTIVPLISKNEIMPKNQHNLFLFTLKTVDICGVHTAFVSMVMQKLIVSNYEILQIEKHFIGVERKGEKALIYDSDRKYTDEKQITKCLEKNYQCPLLPDPVKCPQQPENSMSCGLYCLFFAICLQEKLQITPKCLSITDNRLFVKDLYNTFCEQEMQITCFLDKYYSE